MKKLILLLLAAWSITSCNYTDSFNTINQTMIENSDVSTYTPYIGAPIYQQTYYSTPVYVCYHHDYGRRPPRPRIQQRQRSCNATIGGRHIPRTGGSGSYRGGSRSGSYRGGR